MNIETIRIFISSPGDVSSERAEARRVIDRLKKRYTGRLNLVPVFWEDLPLQAGMSFQEGINLLLSERNGIDVAVFILWARLGTPVGNSVLRADGSRYRSGTECELELMLEARERSGGKRPAVLVYTRQDDAGLLEKKRSIVNSEDLREFEDQEKKLRRFIAENFEDEETGQNLRAYLSFEEPVTFSQRLFTHLKGILDESGAETGDWDVAERGFPYQGLEMFDVDHSDIFFGRDEEICEVLDQLQRKASLGCAFVLIVGASGSGKSSLARAGVMPSIQPFGEISEWRRVVFTPGEARRDPVGGLAEALCQALPELAPNAEALVVFAEGLKKDPELTLRMRMGDALGRDPLRQSDSGELKVILLIDQLEELFTHSEISKGARAIFIAALDALATNGFVYVLATVRADFYGRCQELPVLMKMKMGGGQFDLLPPQAGAYHAMITKPAYRSGYTFESRADTGQSLEKVVFNEAISHPEALPHVEFLLRSLFAECEGRSDRTLTFEAYDRLGGVSGAIAKRAEDVYQFGDGVTDSNRAAFPSIMRRLVTLRGETLSTTPVRTRVLYDDLLRIPDAQPLVDAFIDARLFIAGIDDSGRAVISVTHETLFRSWRRMADWISENSAHLRDRGRLLEAIATWKGQDKHDHYLLPAGKPLEDADALANAMGLTPDEAEFLFRSNLLANRELLGWSDRFHEISPELHQEAVSEALRDSSERLRLSAVYIAGFRPTEESTSHLTEMVFDDPSEEVRKECAISLGEIDDPDSYGRILDRLSVSDQRHRAIRALSRLRILMDGPLSTIDRAVEPLEFGKKHAQIDRKTRSLIRVHAWATRLREGFSVIPLVVVPATIFASVMAACFKWIPASFNLAICQATASAGMGVFHGVSAGVIWAGSIILALTLYRVVFGREQEYKGMFRPVGAIAAGTTAGLVGSSMITLVIISVFEPVSLRSMGWIIEDSPRFSAPFLNDLFFETRFGWAYLCSGTSLGIGMAMMTNLLRSSGAWENFLSKQSPLTSFGQCYTVSKRIMGVAFRFSAPLFVMLLIGGTVEYFVCRPPVEPPSKWGDPPWGNTELFLALSIAGDCASKLIGGFFAIVGMGVGIVIIRHGVHLEPGRS